MATDPTDPLELARAQLSRLRDADDWDEPTGKTEVTVNLQVPSQPDIPANVQALHAPTRPNNDVPEPAGPAALKGVLAVMDRLPPAHRWVVVVLAAAVAALAGHQVGLW